MKFLRCFLRRHFARKLVVASWKCRLFSEAREIRLHLTLWVKWNKGDIFGKSAPNSFLTTTTTTTLFAPYINLHDPNKSLYIMQRVQAAHYDNSHDSAALLRLLINACTRHHTQLHTKHTHTQKKRRKKLVKKKKERKERQQKKAKYASIKQRKFRKNMVLINLQLIFINKNWLLINFFLKGFRERSLMSSLISFQTLAPWNLVLKIP